MSETAYKIIGIVVLVIVIGATIFYVATPQGRAVWNKRAYDIQKADDATNYKTLKKVEDTCRAMISSYETDKLTYEQYKDSDKEEKQGWAEQAKMRANKTASTYNNYILKNSIIWEDDVPSDIYMELEIIE
jgi:hypothetical protein